MSSADILDDHTSICIQVTSVMVTCATATSAVDCCDWMRESEKKCLAVGANRTWMWRHVDSFHMVMQHQAAG